MSRHKGSTLTGEHKAKIAAAMTGKYPSSETRKKMSESAKRRPPMSDNTRAKVSASSKARAHGSLNPAWKGGVTPENQKLRNSVEYKAWRIAVYQRDDYTCQRCNKRGGNLVAHHIQPWATCLELRFELSNGETLCERCHRAEHFPQEDTMTEDEKKTYDAIKALVEKHKVDEEEAGGRLVTLHGYEDYEVRVRYLPEQEWDLDELAHG